MEILDGKYVANGEKNLFTKISGEGSPAVVIEPGWAGMSVDWEPIQRELSKETTVISYDRAGYCESPASDNKRTGMKIAEELYNALKNSGVNGPYVFIGHDAGGFYSQLFFKMFPNEIAGLVLVDSLTENHLQFREIDAPTFNKIFSLDTMKANFKQYSDMKSEDFEKQVAPALLQFFQNRLPHIREAMGAYLSDNTIFKTTLAEMEEFEESAKFYKDLSIFSNIPVRILCRDIKSMTETLSKTIPEKEAKLSEELWLKLSKDMLNLSTDSEFFIVENAGHDIHIENPKAVVDTVKSILPAASEL